MYVYLLQELTTVMTYMTIMWIIISRQFVHVIKWLICTRNKMSVFCTDTEDFNT